MNDEPFVNISPLVEAISAALPPYFDKPFAFLGHSMGALISFDLARHLRRLRRPGPVQLFVSGRPAPQAPDLDSPTYNLPEPEFMAELRRLNGTPKEALDHPELMQLLLPIIRADFSICQTYVYLDEPPLECPIDVYGGRQDADILPEHLEAWRSQTSSSFTMQMFEGDHFFIHSAQDQFLQTLRKKLIQIVANIMPATPGM
jgi:medium-chain acyl-[acyl-carrier-protein] hydrolase